MNRTQDASLRVEGPVAVYRTSCFASLPVATRIKTVVVMMVVMMMMMMIVPAIARHDDRPPIPVRRIPIARIEGVVMVVMMVMMVIVLNHLDVGF